MVVAAETTESSREDIIQLIKKAATTSERERETSVPTPVQQEQQCEQ